MNNIANKVNLLLSKMTLREKIAQCVMLEPAFCVDALNKKESKEYKDMRDPEFVDRLINEFNAGFILFGGITRIGNDLDIDWKKFINQVQNKAKQSRLGIPVLVGVDAVHGANFIKEATIFPHNLSIASSWNEDLTKSYTKNVSNELSEIGVNVNFSPTIDVARDQRWGRVYESLGEDSYLASKLAKALVEGAQETSQVAACAKHFVGYGEASNGMDRTPANLSERAIYEHHLPPFEQAIKSDVKTLMINGADVNGTPMPASKKYLTRLLRETLEFDGLILSDWEDVFRLYERHKIAKNKKDAIKKAFNAGLDLNMIVADFKTLDLMEELLEENEISIERLDQTVRRVLTLKYQLGLFDKSYKDDSLNNKTYRDESRDLAKEIVLDSITLLKNNDNLLPLSKKTKRILLTGKTANSKRHLCGGWTLNWASAHEEDLQFPTIYDALKSYLPDAEVTLVENINELKETSNDSYDIILSVVGEEPHSEWLGDTFDMQIEEDEMELLQHANQLSLPHVMISTLGRPMDLNWMDQNVDSILYTYLVGSEGANAIIETLFGDNNPSGKTPITFPKNPNEIPCVYNPRRYQSYEIETKYNPLYPFGYGLSYTEFKYTDLKAPKEISIGEPLTLKVTIKNTGKVSGKEVVQLYLRDEYASITRPLKSLKGFQKVSLQPNETQTLEFTLTKQELGLYNEDLEFVEEKRVITILIDDLSHTFEII